jgi:hypothetical protein
MSLRIYFHHLFIGIFYFCNLSSGKLPYTILLFILHNRTRLEQIWYFLMFVTSFPIYYTFRMLHLHDIIISDKSYFTIHRVDGNIFICLIIITTMNLWAVFSHKYALKFNCDKWTPLSIILQNNSKIEIRESILVILQTDMKYHS